MLGVFLCSPSGCKLAAIREVREDEREDSLLSFDDELVDVRYCDDDDNIDAVADTVVEDNVVDNLDVDVVVEESGKGAQVEF